MRSLTIHFFNGKTVAGWFIKTRLSTILSHCVVEFDDGFVIDSMLLKGVHETTMDKLQTPTASITLTISDAAYNRTRDYAEEQLGQIYDWKAIVGFIFAAKYQNDKGLFCSELCYDVFSIATGVRLNTYTLITPGQLRLVLETYISVPNEKN